MRIKAMPVLAALSMLALAFPCGGVAPVQAQSAPVQKDQTPSQAEQSHDQDRSRAEDTKIGRDWKAQDTNGDTAGRAGADRSQETVGRDWRAYPKDQDR